MVPAPGLLMTLGSELESTENGYQDLKHDMKASILARAAPVIGTPRTTQA